MTHSRTETPGVPLGAVVRHHHALDKTTVAATIAVVAVLILVHVVQISTALAARGLPFDLRQQMGVELAFWGSWIVIGLSLIRIGTDERPRPAFVAADRRRVVLLHGALAVAAFLLQPMLNAAIVAALGMRQATAFWPMVFRFGIGNGPNNAQISAGLIAVSYALRYYQRYRERDRAASLLADQLAASRLHALRSQLNPHFLFNSMNAIAMLARRGSNAEVVRMVTGLSDLLRETLDDDRPQLVPLSHELEFVSRYLAIEQVRFGDRLRVEREVAPECLGAAVPSFLLQPLVENAVRHGISARAAAGRVRLSAQRRGERLHVVVSDDGPGLYNGSATEGLGLRNTRSRLAQLYGDGATLRLHEVDEGGVACEVELPFSTATASAT